MPFFSVIIPVYNKESYIQQTIESVLSQDFVDYEIIIINDGSTDNSEEKLKQFSDSRIRYFYQKNLGVSVARNFGINLSQSNFITFLDADDYWYPNFLQTMYHNIKRFPEQKVFSAGIEIEYSKKKILKSQYSIIKTGDCELVNYFKSSYKETVICTSSAVFDKIVFETAGNFDVTMRSGQDTDLWIRIGLQYDILFCWEILARYVHDPHSLSKIPEYINSKVNFSKFHEMENKNYNLKKFLDLNRYSLAIKCKLNNDIVHFNKFYKDIHLKNLSLKKKVLLRTPRFILKFLLILQLKLLNIGLLKSGFR